MRGRSVSAVVTLAEIGVVSLTGSAFQAGADLDAAAREDVSLS
jgi:hypothetical protein